MKLGMEYDELKLYTVHINDDPGLTLTSFTPMSNLAKLDFVPRYQVSVYRTIGPLVLSEVTLKNGEKGSYSFMGV